MLAAGHDDDDDDDVHICWPSRLGLDITPTASLQRGKTPPRNQCPGYDTKQSDDEVPVKLWRMHSTPSLALFSGPL